MTSPKIDQDLYSRQIYVLGNQAMVKLAEAKILLHGLGSLGLEIAKNLVLAGVGSLTIVDNQKCDFYDLGSQFFTNQKHIESKTNRLSASIEKLRELNPYVKIECLEKDISTIKLDEFLKAFKCVIITELDNRETLIRINSICRQNSVQFIFTNVYGLFGFSFTDFGESFETLDTDGEEYRDMFISSISNDLEACVEVLDQHAHNLEKDDFVRLTEIEDPNELNNQVYRVTAVLNSYKFKIEANTSETKKYSRGGIFRKIKKKQTIQFGSLESQLKNPELVLADLSATKFSSPNLVHVLVKSHLTLSGEKQSEYSLETFLKHVKEASKEEDIERLARVFYLTKRARFPPLSAIYGGVCAQEALKSITSKFIPIKQWLYLEFSELFEVKSFENFNLDVVRKNDRYDNLRECFGGELTLSRLFDTRLFMVGCGAIGCEMLKNYALLGVGSGGESKGLITITDNDLIEKSNLNRQFLFRQSDINQPKSQVAAAACKHINPDIRIRAHELKVCAQTERDVFNNEFFQSQDFCVNALDNLEARRYMDSRCVTNQKALLESGTLGSKGHVQVILPHLTESYASQKDPNDAEGDIPYCTLKSFPSMIEHCIQWSRDKFESLLKIKPSLVEKFFTKNADNIDTVLANLKSSSDDSYFVEDAHKVAKMLTHYCFTLDDCVVLARSKFEKYFAHKAKDILYAYPLDHLMSDNSPFWKLPKRPPSPIVFDFDEPMHAAFVRSLTRLYADLYAVEAWKEKLDEPGYLKSVLDANKDKIPVWKPRKKHIETDESKKKNEVEQTNSGGANKNEEMNNQKCSELIETFLSKFGREKVAKLKQLNKLEFEKDNDLNGHIDFIHATSNLRAIMYSIETADRMHAKKIAGKIVPAIATTTSCIAGFVSVELVRLVQHGARPDRLDDYRNVFLNLAIALVVLSEPGVCVKTQLTENCFVSLWDKWEVRGNEAFTLKNFIDSVKKTFHLTCSGVIHGSKPIYMSVMPGHIKRLNEKMLKLIKGVQTADALRQQPNSTNYVDLVLTYEECEKDDKNNLCPPIRYYFY